MSDYNCVECGWNRIILDDESIEDAREAHEQTAIHHIDGGRTEPFDSYEVMKVAEYPDPGSEPFCEPITTHEEQEQADDEAIRQFWTVYGHRQERGVVAIADYETMADAIAMATALSRTGKVPVFVEGEHV